MYGILNKSKLIYILNMSRNMTGKMIKKSKEVKGDALCLHKYF